MTSASLSARAFAALVVLALFPVFVLLVVLGVCAAAIFLASKTTGSAGAHLFVLVIPLIVAVGAATREVMRARKQEPLPGHELTEQDHPQIWAELATISWAMHQPLPDRVVVAPIVNAMVTTRAGQREVLIGYPLLVGLNRLQLRAVLAHEMGHLAHGHTRTGALAYRMGGILDETVHRMDPGVVRTLVSGYHRLYLLIALSVMRDHERQADQWAAELAGGPQAATIFAELARADAAWDLLCEHYLPLAARVKARPGVAMAMQQLRQAHDKQLDELAASRTSRAASRWSSHPADRERIRFLERAPAVEPGPADLYPAWQLLGPRPAGDRGDTPDWNAAGTALLEVEAAMLPTGSHPATWEQVIEDAQISAARATVSLALDQLVVQSPSSPLTLRGLLQAMSEGPGTSLVAPLMQGDLPAAEREEILERVLEETAATATQLAVLNAGRARWALRWDGPAELEYLDETGAAQPWPEQFTITRPINAYSVNPLLTHVYNARISIDAPLVDDLEAEAHARTLHSITKGGVTAVQVRPPGPGQRKTALFELLLMDDGLLIAPAKGITTGDKIKMAFQAQYTPGSMRRHGAARIKALAIAVDGDPKAYAGERRRGAIWVPYSEVTRARFKTSAAALAGMATRTLTLNWPGGRGDDTIAIRWTRYSVEIGEVDDLLARALDV